MSELLTTGMRIEDIWEPLRNGYGVTNPDLKGSYIRLGKVHENSKIELHLYFKIDNKRSGSFFLTHKDLHRTDWSLVLTNFTDMFNTD